MNALLQHEDWNIPDPKTMLIEEYRTIRDIIEVKVKDLLSKL
jgi:protein-tyrosine-phosphatase